MRSELEWGGAGDPGSERCDSEGKATGPFEGVDGAGEGQEASGGPLLSDLSSGGKKGALCGAGKLRKAPIAGRSVASGRVRRVCGRRTGVERSESQPAGAWPDGEFAPRCVRGAWFLESAQRAVFSSRSPSADSAWGAADSNVGKSTRNVLQRTLPASLSESPGSADASDTTAERGAGRKSGAKRVSHVHSCFLQDRAVRRVSERRWGFTLALEGRGQGCGFMVPSESEAGINLRQGSRGQTEGVSLQ